MEGDKGHPATIDEYIAGCPAEAQPILQKIRATIREAAPAAVEKISYQMPAFDQDGVLVYFGLHTRHVGFYPTGEGMEAFKEELGRYKTSKGAAQFPLDQPIPYELITRIVKHRLVVNQKSAEAKQKPPAKKGTSKDG
jgi:uncharacterized protein YdhG (YjbR/CyaY superfamily)